MFYKSAILNVSRRKNINNKQLHISLITFFASSIIINNVSALIEMYYDIANNINNPKFNEMLINKYNSIPVNIYPKYLYFYIQKLTI